MSTSGLSSQLQDYLKKSNTENSSTSSLLQNPLSGKFGWFTAKNNSSHQQTEEATVNGWFADAQKDPLLPSLVSPYVLEQSGFSAAKRPRVFCGLADLRTNQWVFCGPKNADCVCGPVGKMRTCGPLKFQLFS